jgi:hypothetical protein
MRMFLAGLTAATLVVMLGTPAFAKTMTVKGQVVDEGCSLRDMASRKDGASKMSDAPDACAIECAKRGEPLALLTADGKVYRIGGGLAANKNAKLIAHMNHTVEITGDVAEQDGKIVISADALKMSK